MRRLISFTLLGLLILSPTGVQAQGLVPCGFDRNGDGVVQDIDVNGDGEFRDIDVNNDRKIEVGVDIIEVENCQLCHLFTLINNIIQWVLTIFVPVVAPIFFVIGGLYLLVARGNPETYGKGKTVLTATVIGLIITYAAWVLLNTVLTSLGVAQWTGLGTWWQLTGCP